MSIEAIGSASAAASASVSGLTSFDSGPTFGADTVGGFSFLKEGPVNSLEGFVPMGKSNLGGVDLTGGTYQSGFSPVGEILFQNKPQLSGSVIPFKEADVLAEAESILAQARAPEPQLINLWAKVAKPKKETIPGPAVIAFPGPKPAIATEAKQVVQSKTEAQTVNRAAARAVVEPYPQKQEAEEVVEEKVLAKDEHEDKNESKNEDDASISRVKLVEAESISKGRKQKIIAGVKKLAQRLIRGGKITGKRVKEALSGEFWKLKSPIVAKGKDYTLDLTVAEIVANSEGYENTEEAEKAFVKAVDNNIPIKKGGDGRTATIEEVRKVVYGQQEKPKTPAEIVYKRVVKKTIVIEAASVKTAENVTQTIENNLKDLNLEEVLIPKAA